MELQKKFQIYKRQLRYHISIRSISRNYAKNSINFLYSRTNSSDIHFIECISYIFQLWDTENTKYLSHTMRRSFNRLSTKKFSQDDIHVFSKGTTPSLNAISEKSFQSGFINLLFWIYSNNNIPIKSSKTSCIKKNLVFDGNPNKSPTSYWCNIAKFFPRSAWLFFRI